MMAPPIAPREGVEDLCIDTAEALLDLLNPRHEMWRPNPSRWLFRGQTDARWLLQPSAYRDTVATFASYGISTRTYDGQADWSLRAALLNNMLIRFGDGLNQVGLPLPAAHVELTWRRRRQYHSSAEPEHHLYPLMALAQHHGLPTTLLDWSRRGNVGAYFAAVHMADETKRRDVTHVAVWALHRPPQRTPDEGLLFFEAPASTNPNLHAQDGLFTIIPPSEEDDRCIEDYLVRMTKSLAKLGETDARARTVLPRLRRIIVPVAETKKLLRLLSYEGVTGASMFPGNDGVVRAMRERVLWDGPVQAGDE